MTPFADWMPIIRKLESALIYDTRDLAEISYSEITGVVDLWHRRPLVLSIWKAASISSIPRGNLPTSLPIVPNASLAAQTSRVNDIDESAPPDLRRVGIGDFALPANFNTVGQGAEIKAIALHSRDPSSICCILESGVAMNVTRQRIDSLPVVAAAISFTLHFAVLFTYPTSPTTARRVKRCVCFPNDGATYSVYVNNLPISRQILELDTPWRNDGIGAAVRGLKRARVRDSKFGNFILRGISISLMRGGGLDRPPAK